MNHGIDTEFTDDTVHASAEAFDPGSGIWAPTASMSTGRTSFTLTRLADGARWPRAGVPGPGPAVASAEVYESSR